MRFIKFIREQVRTVKKKDPSVRSSFEVILYPGFWAVIFHKAAHFLYKNGHFFSARLISAFGRFLTGIEIHPGAKIGRRLFIDHGAGVVIGETSVIGNDVLIYQGVTLGGTGKDVGKRHPTIGNGVMIGAGVKILGPFKVGDGSRIGAGSVVLCEVPPHCTVVGVPAKVIKSKGRGKCNANCLDQTHFPNVIESDINDLKIRIEKLENAKIKVEGEIYETL